MTSLFDKSLDDQYHSSVFFFTECLSIILSAGRKLYGKKFKLHQEDYDIFFQLLVYFMNDQETAANRNIDLEKGILLLGPIGCGKTSVLNIFRYVNARRPSFKMISCRNVSFQFNREGYPTILNYSDHSFKSTKQKPEPITYCFDDLGAEDNIKYFGNDCNVMAEILLSRYDHFVNHGMTTHMTTNLNSNEVEKVYGNRVRSRMRSMFNVVSFPKNSVDKRS